MNGTGYRKGMSWSARLLIGLALVVVGAIATTWALAHYQTAAKFLGVVPPSPPASQRPLVAQPPANAQPTTTPALSSGGRLAQVEARLSRVENATQRAEGFAGRADALVVAFAARRAIDRGVALGSLEPLLVDRFGAQHQQAVVTIVTASHQPIRLN